MKTRKIVDKAKTALVRKRLAQLNKSKDYGPVVWVVDTATGSIGAIRENVRAAITFQSGTSTGAFKILSEPLELPQYRNMTEDQKYFMLHNFIPVFYSLQSQKRVKVSQSKCGCTCLKWPKSTDGGIQLQSQKCKKHGGEWLWK